MKFIRLVIFSLIGVGFIALALRTLLFTGPVSAPLALPAPTAIVDTHVHITGHIATTGDNEQQGNYQRILSLFDQYPKLYADISSLTQMRGISNNRRP